METTSDTASTSPPDVKHTDPDKNTSEVDEKHKYVYQEVDIDTDTGQITPIGKPSIYVVSGGVDKSIPRNKDRKYRTVLYKNRRICIFLEDANIILMAFANVQETNLPRNFISIIIDGSFFAGYSDGKITYRKCDPPRGKPHGLYEYKELRDCHDNHADDCVHSSLCWGIVHTEKRIASERNGMAGLTLDQALLKLIGLYGDVAYRLDPNYIAH